MRLRTTAQLAGPCLLMVGIWFAGSWVPTQTSSVDDRKQDAQAELELLTDELEAARSLGDVTDELDLEIAVAEAAVPSTAEMGRFVRDAGAAGVRTGISVGQIAPLAVSSDTDPESLLSLPVGTSSVLVSVGATGRYLDLVSFVDELTAMDRLVLVDAIEFRSDEGDSDAVVLDLELRIFTTAVLTTEPQSEDDFFALEGDEGGDG